VRAAGACGTLTVRADSGFYRWDEKAGLLDNGMHDWCCQVDTGS